VGALSLREGTESVVGALATPTQEPLPTVPAQTANVERRLVLVDWFILLCAAICASTAAFALASWVASVVVGPSVAGANTLANPGSAVLFALCAACLVVQRDRVKLRWLPRVIRSKLTVAVPSALTLTAFGTWVVYAVINISARASGAMVAGTSGALAPGTWEHDAYVGLSGWMSSGSAFTFSFLGSSFLARLRWPWLALVNELFWAALIFVILLWYAYQVASVVPVGALSSTNMTSVVAFLALLAGMMALDLREGPLRVLVYDGPAGEVTRRLLPVGLVAPPLIGYFRLQGELVGYYDTTVGIALFASALIGVFSVTVGMIARALGRVETQRLAAEEARRSSEERFSRAFHASPVAMTITEAATGVFIDLNEAAENMLGYRRAEVLGKTSTDLGIMEAPARESLVAQYRRDGKARNQEVRVITRTGDKRTVLLSAEFVDLDQTRSLLAVMVDITERRAAEDALRASQEKLTLQATELSRSNAELEQFAYVASHDLQEPLRMISSYLQLIERRYKAKLDTDADEFIRFSVDGAKRMQSLINDLLTFSRVGTRGKPFERVETEKTLGEALANLEVAIEESGGKVTHGPLPAVNGDPGQLTQLFQNLVGNAVKFHGKDPPEVRVEATHNDSQWEFAVRDNGIGIDPNHFDRVFIVFQRLHGRDEYPGTGIGLAICKKIVERHGGRIWVESEPGKGSAFHFTLPDKREPGVQNA
jgi:PAS domain S-box-containing protein